MFRNWIQTASVNSTHSTTQYSQYYTVNYVVENENSGPKKYTRIGLKGTAGLGINFLLICYCLVRNLT